MSLVAALAKPAVKPAPPKETFRGALANIGRGLYRMTAKFAGYGAAYPTNSTRVGGRLGLNGNTSTASIQRLGMSFTADMVCKDNPLCTAYLTQRQNYCSSVLTWLPATPDSGLNRAITEYLHGHDGCGGVFSTMGVDCSMQDAFMRTADLECPVKGDSGMIGWRADDDSDYRLLEFSADQLGEVYAFTPERKCSLAREITRDKKGNIVHIELREVSGNDCTYYAGRYFRGPDCVAYKIYARREHWYGEPVIYDAADVHYFRDPAAYRGYRGVTLFHTALPYMQKSDDLLSAALGIAQRQARTSHYVFNNSGEPNPEPSYDVNPSNGRVDYFERIGDGPFAEHHFIGDTVVPNTPTAPGTDVINGVEASDEKVALGLRMSYGFLINGAKLGGVTARGDTQKVWKEFCRIQNTIHRPRLNRIKDITLMDSVRRNLLSIPRGMTSAQFLCGRWMLPTSPVTDAFNDAREDIDMVREGLESPQDVIAETNRDWRDVVKKSGEWREAVQIEAETRTKNLRDKGFKGTITAQEISATSDNPMQQSQAEQIDSGAGKPPAQQAKMAAPHDVSGEKRADDGKWTSGGGGGKTATIEKPKAKVAPKTQTLKPTKDRAWNGATMAVKSKLSKLETGALGENAVISYLKDQGFSDARTYETSRNNAPIDLLQDHELIEVKTGFAGNGDTAQHWRATIGQPGPEETKWLKTASKEEKKKHNAMKAAAIMQRKTDELEAYKKQTGRDAKGKTITTIINPDTRTIDIFEHEGFHLRIPWNSPEAKAAYKGSFKY